MESLNPIDVLKEELDTDDVASKVNAIHKLKIVATILGPEGIRNALLPYLDCTLFSLLSAHKEGGGRGAVRYS